MSGDWIKMRADLFTHPKVIRISSALKADKLRTVGGLMSVWCLFDAHSENGVLVGYTTEAIDSHLGWSGFSAAMIAVGWLDIDGESVALPRFDTHNGASSKRRAQDADRKRNVRKESASEADKLRTREEKRREEEKKEQEPRARDDEKCEKPTAAGSACRAIMANGIQANPSHPDLLAAIAEGTTTQEFADAAAECKTKGKGFAYLLAMVRRRKAETAAPVARVAPPRPREVTKPERRFSDEERKRSLGENLPAILKHAGVKV